MELYRLEAFTPDEMIPAGRYIAIPPRGLPVLTLELFAPVPRRALLMGLEDPRELSADFLIEGLS